MLLSSRTNLLRGKNDGDLLTRQRDIITFLNFEKLKGLIGAVFIFIKETSMFQETYHCIREESNTFFVHLVSNTFPKNSETFFLIHKCMQLFLMKITCSFFLDSVTEVLWINIHPKSHVNELYLREVAPKIYDLDLKCYPSKICSG